MCTFVKLKVPNTFQTTRAALACIYVLWAVRILLSLRDKMDNIKHQAKTVKCFAVIDRFYVRV